LEFAQSKTEIVVSFLAMLELIKQKEVVVEQAELFGEIEINKI
jgi:chromatin segregation and condensation protein Rec8/ScpA/Scc1 (kleisin family)